MPNLSEATRLLGVYTAGRFDIYALAGPARASCRSHILSILTGEKTPQSKSGVTALREAFYSAALIDGNCERTREINFAAWVRHCGFNESYRGA